jgi:hypothetical protein
MVAGVGFYLRTRLDTDQAFLHELINSNRQERATQAAAWRQMANEMNITSSQTVEALNAIRTAIEEHDRKSAMRDAQVAHVLEEMCKRLETTE